ncbi:hypothetical protein pb186bvf_016040 [Paramecium bursaria]
MRNNVSGIQTKNQYPQQQQQLQVQRQLQGETQYTIYKDLENFLGVLVESNVVCSELDKDDPLVDIHRNRLIAQLNLSKSIHYDTQSTADDNNNYDQLSGLKKDALNIFQQYLKEHLEIDGRIQLYLDQYKNLLEKRQETLQITKLIPTNRINNLQESQINNLLNSMNAVDQDYQRLRKGEQFQLDQKQLFKRINDRIKVAEAKLKNYNQQSPSQNQKQKISKQQQEELEDQEQYQLSNESIQIINLVIKLSSGNNSEFYITELKKLINNIISSKQIQINTKQQWQEQIDKKVENPVVNKIVLEIESILSKLQDKNKAKQMVTNIKNYLFQFFTPLSKDWINKFEKQDIKIVEEFMANSKK